MVKTEPSKMKMSRRRLTLIIVAVSVVLLLVGLILWYFFDRNSGSSDEPAPLNYSTALQSIADTNSEVKDMERFVSEYGQYFDEASDKVLTSNASKWNQEDVNRAHLTLVYADRVGLFTQVLSIHSQISYAKTSGIDVDNNVASIGQAERDSILERANALAGEGSESGE